MIFVDSNIPMYLVGAPHANKSRAQEQVEALIAAQERLVTDAEVLQEILNRYVAIDRRDAIQPAFDALLGVTDEVLSIGLDDVERAKEILLGLPSLSARDAIDSGFDGVPGLTRIA